MSSAMTQSVYEKLQDFVRCHQLASREVEHEPEGRTDIVSQIRGNDLAAAVKAMVIMVKRGKSERRYFLACVPGNKRVDFDALKRLGAGSEARFAPEDRAIAMAGCPMGAVPPLSFHADLKLVVDPALLKHQEVVFNSGRLDRSLFVEPNTWFNAAGAAVERIAI